MSISKNFVVKNGFEASTDLILADADTRKVGIGTTRPEYTLDVRGGIGATDAYVSGISTFVDELNVGLGGTVLTVLGIGGSVGIGTANPAYLLDVRTVSAGQTALYVQGDIEIAGDIRADDISITNLNVSSISTFVGFSTFNDYVFIQDGLNVTGAGATLTSLNVVGLTTLNSNVDILGAFNISGISSFNNYVSINDDINISGNLNVSGISTIENINVTGATFSSIVVSGISSFNNYVNINDDVNISGNLNVSGLTTLTSAYISSSITASNLTVIENLQVGGNDDILLSGINNTIVGVTTLQSTNADISNLESTNIESTNIETTNLIVNNKLKITGINSFTSGVSTVTINGSYTGLSTSYELFLPESLGGKGQVLALGENGTLEFANSLGLFENRIYVSTGSGDDANDGKSGAVKTIKRASQLASFQSPVAIIVESGEYVENNPIILYENVAIIGDNLRTTIIRPLNAGKDLFRLRNGCYLTNVAMKDFVDNGGVPQHTFNFAVAFDDPSDTLTSRSGYAVNNTKTVITRSPYIQNCSILSFLGANGVLVDGSKVLVPNTTPLPQESENPVVGDQPEFGKSMVAATFTMVSFGGIGWKTINDGYAQVVSCFQIFCRYGSLVQSGGYLSITNSATNFGLIALQASGYNANCYNFDRGLIVATGTIAGRQTLKVVGLGRFEQDLYVLRFINKSTNIDQTGLFKPLSISREVDISVGVNTSTDIIQISNHGFVNEDKVLYLANESGNPSSIIGGLISDNEYYIQYINDNQFQLYDDDSLSRLVNLTSFSVGINTFQKGNLEFFNQETVSFHNSYQIISLGSTTETLNFVPGRAITQTTDNGSAFGYVYDYDDQANELIVSVEETSGIRVNFGVTGIGTNTTIQDHSDPSVIIGITSTTNTNQYYTSEFKVNSTDDQSIVANIANLPEDYILQFHRPSIINSSSHTWEFSGSGTDYNALPQNGGKADSSTEQAFSLGGRVYASGTNELGDFKIGTQITAFNRTGKINFDNTVSIAEIDSINLSLSGGVSVSEFSTDIGLGDNESGGPKNERISTQLAVRSFLNTRLGNFIDKSVSTSPIPNSVLQLNSIGQINSDLIPPRIVNFYITNVGGGRTALVDRIPSVNIKQGDTVIEPDGGFVLISDNIGEFLILDDNTRNYNFNNSDEVVSTISAGSAIGIVTAPTSVGYGTTGLVKGVLLSINNLNGGSGYSNPGIYTSIPLVSVTGAGTSALASVTINGSGTVSNVEVVYGGKDYVIGNDLSASSSSIGGIGTGGSPFEVTVNNVETRLYLKLTNNIKFPGSLSLPDFIKDNDSVGISTSLNVNYTTLFNPTDISISGDIDFANNRIVVGVSSYSDGDPVIYSSEGGSVLTDLISANTYYIKKVGISSVELYSTYALSNRLSLLSSGTGTHSLTRVGVNTSTDQIVFVNHGFDSTDAVRVSGNTPTGITTNSFYFVGSVTTNSFTLHETQVSSVASANGLIINPVNLTSSGSGTITFTKQNVTYNKTVNTSSSLLDNWSLLSGSLVDAQNIISGIISPSRLGTGAATENTFLAGNSSYQKIVKSVSIASTEPITVVSSSSDFSSGITTHYGNLELSLNKVQSTINEFSTYGTARFKTSSFGIDGSGSISIKNTTNGGDIDAATFGGQVPAFYLDINNITGSLPITRGGTGLSALPSNGHLLVGNGSSYNLTGSPTISGTLTAVDFNSTSDINLKENIQTVENALETISTLRGVSFDWKETGKSSYGVIAQELEEVLPELVKTGEIKSVNYNGIIGVLIEAIKELKKEVQEIKSYK